jgi:hypothetical protein
MAKQVSRKTAPIDSTIEESSQPLQEDRQSGQPGGTIAMRAYQLWLERGCPEGSPDEDWFRAEQELTNRKKSVARAGSSRTDRAEPRIRNAASS